MKILVASIVALVGSSVAMHAIAADPAIELPEFVISETWLLPPPEAWRYARAPGFEILATVRDGETQRLLRELRRFQQVIEVIMPGLQRHSGGPISVILTSREREFEEFRPTGEPAPDTGLASLFFKDHESGAIIVNAGMKTFDGARSQRRGVTNEQTGADDLEAGWDGTIDVNAYDQLFREYVRYVLTRRATRLPAWLEEGLVEVIMAVDVTQRSITFAKVKAPPRERTIAPGVSYVTGSPIRGPDFNLALARRPLMPLQEMFAVTHDSPTARYSVGNRWTKQAAAFVHLCLYGRGKRHQKNFLRFAERSAREPVTEELFQECFGMSYKKMLSELRGYLDTADHRYERFVAKGEGLPDIPLLELRDATPAEVGRIKGDALRLGGQAERARLNLIAAYHRGEREPELLAALGLSELSVGGARPSGSFSRGRGQRWREPSTSVRRAREVAPRRSHARAGRAEWPVEQKSGR